MFIFDLLNKGVQFFKDVFKTDEKYSKHLREQLILKP